VVFLAPFDLGGPCDGGVTKLKTGSTRDARTGIPGKYKKDRVMSETNNEHVSDVEYDCVIELTRGHKAVVSNEDFEHLNKDNWCSDGRYAVRQGIMMHRVVAERMGLDISKQIKHRDRRSLKDSDILDNRRTNIIQSNIPLQRRRRPKPKREP
jgi:hypothetical protein